MPCINWLTFWARLELFSIMLRILQMHQCHYNSRFVVFSSIGAALCHNTHQTLVFPKLFMVRKPCGFHCLAAVHTFMQNSVYYFLWPFACLGKPHMNLLAVIDSTNGKQVHMG